MSNMFMSLLRFVILFLPFIKEAYANRKDTQFGRKETNPFSMLMLEGTLLFFFFIYMSFFAFTANEQNVLLQNDLITVQHLQDKTTQELTYTKSLSEVTEDRLEMMTALLEQYRYALSLEQERGAGLIIRIKELENKLGKRAEVEALPIPNQGYRRPSSTNNINRLLHDLDN